MAQIKVYRKDTGEIVYVPEHFMDHPVLSKPFRKTPSQKTSEAAAQAEIEVAAVAAIHQTPDSSAAEPANPPPTSESADAGDDKKE